VTGVQTWLFRSRYRGEFKEGHAALDSAKKAYEQLPEASTRLAAIKLARAIMFLWQRLYDRALPLAREAVDDYHESGQELQEFEAKQVEATVLHRLGDVDAAVAAYRVTLDIADRLDDPEMKARAAKY